MKKGHTLGIILILIGIAWIIRQAGLISVNWAAAIKTLWPVFLVAAGASFLLGHKRRLVSGIWILTFAVFIGFGIYKRDEPTRLINFEKNLEIDVGPLAQISKTDPETEIPLAQGTENGRLILQFDATKINLNANASNVLVKMDSNIPGLQQRVSQGTQTVLEYTSQESDSNVTPDFNIDLNTGIKWDIDASLGVVEGSVNLEEIPVENIHLALGVGELIIRFGQKQEITRMDLWSGATALDIYVPQGSGLKIKQGKLISDLEVHQMPMIEQDGYLISENYETAAHKIEIEVASAISEIEVFVQ
ncbi:MAG: hypothetical protein KBA53_10040 [Thermoclostridium sp.]|nr:hypothetical protein [Thermoclostridium sp.]